MSRLFIDKFGWPDLRPNTFLRGGIYHFSSGGFPLTTVVNQPDEKG